MVDLAFIFLTYFFLILIGGLFFTILYWFTIASLKTVAFKVLPIKPRIQSWKAVFIYLVCLEIMLARLVSQAT